MRAKRESRARVSVARLCKSLSRLRWSGVTEAGGFTFLLEERCCSLLDQHLGSPILVGFLDVLLGDFLGALGVVVGVQGLLILVERPVPLTRHIEDLAQVDVAPHFNPLRVQIAVEGLPERVGCGLGAALLQEHLAYPEEGQRTSLFQLDRPLILG